MNSSAVFAILGYIHEHLDKPSMRSQFCFQLWSYAKWAAYEIVDRILDDPQTPAVVTVEDFLMSANTGQNYIFLTAKETACDILDILRAMT